MKPDRHMVEKYKEMIKEHLYMEQYFDRWYIWLAESIALEPGMSNSIRGEMLQALFTAKRELEDEAN